MTKRIRKVLSNKKGFTLVEVIVVAVIVAALAAVAIGVYTTYVDNARQNSVNNAAGSLASFCGAAKNAGNAVAAVGPVAAGNNIFDSNATAADRTSWMVPTGMTATVTAANITVTGPGGKTSTVPY